MLGQDQRQRLVSAARAAAAQAFVTSPGGTAYGAAVLTASGNLYQAGQYSSLNHATSVHAEQVALLLATMAGDLDVLGLAVASTGTEPVTRPCGMCRQVMAEHAVRVGRDFEVLMACRHSNCHEMARVTQLLPLAWSPGEGRSAERPPDLRPALSQSGERHVGESLSAGDHVLLSDGCVAMVWDGEFEPGGALIKVKYAPSERGLRKVAHSFTEPLRYLKELHDLSWSRPTGCGIRAPVVKPSEVSAVFKSLPLGTEVGEPPGPLLGILRDAGVDVAAIRVTGSRATGLSSASSDWDLVVPIDEKRLPVIREQLAVALEKGSLAVPPWSSTWDLVDRIYPGGREAAVRGRRFADTLLSDGVSVALMFVRPPPTAVCVGPGWLVSGRAALHGKVLRASAAGYKRAEYELEHAEGILLVTCYHKAANLLRPGDVISVSGWLIRRGNEQRLIQFLPQPDPILWWETATGAASQESRA